MEFDALLAHLGASERLRIDDVESMTLRLSTATADAANKQSRSVMFLSVHVMLVCMTNVCACVSEGATHCKPP